MYIFYLILLVSTCRSAAAVPTRCVKDQTCICNGLKDLCDLRLHQTTFAGSHNAGSGFDGVLHYWSGGAAISCFYRNHGKSFTSQLNNGIRYFDIDTCYDTDKNEAVNCHCPGTGGDCAYAGSVEKGLRQIDAWMKVNPNEVVVINFNRDSLKGYRQKIAKSLESVLLKLWGPGKTIGMNEYYNMTGKWPKLKDAIISNKAVFIFMNYNLAEYLPRYRWLNRKIIATTWANVVVTPTSCSAITTNAKAMCPTKADFIELSAFGTSGLCTWHMAKSCSMWLGDASEACLEQRKWRRKTVNFLAVDWHSYHYRYESAVNKAKFMNRDNVKRFLGRSIFFPELQDCSYHSGWLYDYCWMVCPKYGWCWTDIYCGKDAGICKRKALSCYSKCGY